MNPKVIWLILVLMRNEGIRLNDLVVLSGFSRSTTLRTIKLLRNNLKMDIRDSMLASTNNEVGYNIVSTGFIDRDEFLKNYGHCETFQCVEDSINK